MAFDKTAARGPSRTRSAVWNARLEVPLPLPPPFRGFLESAHSPTPHPPGCGWRRGVGLGVVAPPGRGLCPACLRRWGGERGRALGGLCPRSSGLEKEDCPQVSAPCVSFVQSGAWGRLAHRKRSEVPQRTARVHGLPQIRRPRPGDIEVSLAVATALRPGAGRPRPLAVRASFSFKICFASKMFFLACFSPEIFRLKK